MSPDDRLSIERRIGHLEQTLAAHSALMKRNTEILDDIREYVNKPARVPEWIAAVIAVLSLCGLVLYTAYVKPLEDRLGYMSTLAEQNRAHIRDIGDYAKETRTVLDNHVDNK